MLTEFAHTAVCVPDVDAAVRWYTEVLGLQLLAGPTQLSGPEIERDMGEVLPHRPVVVKGAILGFGDSGDRVLELIEYPGAECPPQDTEPHLTNAGLSHIGLLCDDLAATREDLEAKGVRFLTSGLAGIVGLRTTWFIDPFGVVFILMDKKRPDKPYYGQFTPRS